MYEDLRPLLFSIAYRMVGSASDAEDIVQEAFLRFHRESNEGKEIMSPKAWLSTVATRLAINHVQSARARRESYVGTWLPEPLLTDTESESARHAETADSLSMASWSCSRASVPSSVRSSYSGKCSTMATRRDRRRCRQERG